jgi:hypothetical protein
MIGNGRLAGQAYRALIVPPIAVTSRNVEML